MVAIGVIVAGVAVLAFAVTRCPLFRAIRAQVSLVAATR